MPKTKISEYSATANSNTDVASINIDEGCAPSGINNAIRAVMGHLKDFQQGTNGDPFNGPVNGTVGATTPASGAFTTLSATGNVTLGDASTDTLNVGNGGLIKDASGNVGVGVTPSAWASFKSMDVNDGGAGLTSSGQNCYLTTNAYYNSGWKYKFTTVYGVSWYEQFNGQHAWFSAPSGTAGNAISATQAMTLDASGNLGVGTTSITSGGGWTPRLVLAAASGSPAWIIKGASNQELSIGASESMYIDCLGATTGANNNIIFRNTSTNSSFTPVERARIDSSGRLIIGNTTMPVGYGTALNVYTTGVGARVYGTAEATGPFWVDKQTNTSSTSQVFIQFTINTQATGNGQINGNGASQVAFGSFSDARLKENIVDLPPQLDNIMALRPVEFDYIESEGGGHQTSFIAQEFEEVYPDAIGERADGMKTLTGWGKTEARLVKAIQEQQVLITQLTARITALEGA